VGNEHFQVVQQVMTDSTNNQRDDSAPAQDAAVPAAGRMSRRRFTGAGIAVPAILTLANRPAFGAICTPSGFVSYDGGANPSGVRHTNQRCGGYSPGAWKNPYIGGDGSFQQWLAAGQWQAEDRFLPNHPQSENAGAIAGGFNFGTFNSTYGNKNNYQPTLFNDAFGYAILGGTTSMHDVLLNFPGSLEFHAVAALLNGGLNLSGLYMDPQDVIDLYLAVKFGNPYVKNGVSLEMSESELKAFFEQTYH
jgi:hypothetical protein